MKHQIEGNMFETESLEGKSYMTSFLRFASFPFSNLRINEYVKRFEEFCEDFAIVAVFDSSLDNLQRHSDKMVLGKNPYHTHIISILFFA